LPILQCGGEKGKNTAKRGRGEPEEPSKQFRPAPPSPDRGERGKKPNCIKLEKKKNHPPEQNLGTTCRKKKKRRPVRMAVHKRRARRASPMASFFPLKEGKRGRGGEGWTQEGTAGGPWPLKVSSMKREKKGGRRRKGRVGESLKEKKGLSESSSIGHCEEGGEKRKKGRYPLRLAGGKKGGISCSGHSLKAIFEGREEAEKGRGGGEA